VAEADGDAEEGLAAVSAPVRGVCCSGSDSSREMSPALTHARRAQRPQGVAAKDKNRSRRFKALQVLFSALCAPLHPRSSHPAPPRRSSLAAPLR